MALHSLTVVVKVKAERRMGVGPVSGGLPSGTVKDSAWRRRWNLTPIQAVEVNVRAVDDLHSPRGLSAPVVHAFAEASSLAGAHRTRVTRS